MAFCANCGRQLADGEVCTCQTPAAPKKKSKKGLVIAVLVLILVVAIGVAVFLLMSNSYKKPINDLTNAINKKETNLDSLVSAALPDFVASSYKKAIKVLKTSDDFSDMYDEAGESLTEMYDELDDSYDTGWKVKFDYGDKEKIEAEDLASISESYAALYDMYFEDICDEISEYDKYDYEDMADSLGISTSKAKEFCKIAVSFMKEFDGITATEGYVLTGRFVLSDSKGETLEKTDKMTIQVIKLNGDWTIDYLSLLRQFGYSSSSLMWQLEDMIDSFY